jgi:uncharacterized protein YlxW (UPF0749 family)
MAADAPAFSLRYCEQAWRRLQELPQEDKDLERAIDGVREEVERLQEDLEPDEALKVLEEAVGEVERLGDRLEEAGS